jgi:methyl-accepting chemotaxis protein
MFKQLNLTKASLYILSLYAVTSLFSVAGLFYLRQGIRTTLDDRDNVYLTKNLELAHTRLLYAISHSESDYKNLLKDGGSGSIIPLMRAKYEMTLAIAGETVAAEDMMFALLGVGGLKEIADEEARHARELNRQLEMLATGAITTEAFSTASTASLHALNASSERYSKWITDASTASSRILITLILITILVTGFLTFSVFRRLRNVLRAVAETLDSTQQALTRASNDIVEQSGAIAEGASRQAAALEQTSASLTEISSMVKSNSQNSHNALEITGGSSEVVEHVSKLMSRLIESMNEISSSSVETKKIVKTIDEIAFQTNLLALNAAVEAARAGTAGLGFAVVANEVRNLAVRSAEAADSTTEKIESAVQNIQKGVALVHQTHDYFKQVNEGASKTGSLMHEISAASREQSVGIEEITKAVQELESVTIAAVSTSESNAATSRILDEQVRALESRVSHLLRITNG